MQITQKNRLNDIIIFLIGFIISLLLNYIEGIQAGAALFGFPELSESVCFATFLLLVYRFIPQLFSYWRFKSEAAGDALSNDTQDAKDTQETATVSQETVEDAEPSFAASADIDAHDVQSTPKTANVVPLTLKNTKPNYRAWLNICLFILIVKIATYLIGYFAALISGHVEGGILQTFDRLWCTTGIDAPSYLGIAENWYVTSGDPMYHIVFFPFYSVMIKAFQLIVGDYLVAAVLVSTLCSFGIGIAGYELVKLEYNEKTALRFVKYTFLLPAAFFYCTPMTEALFVFLCIMTLLFIKKRRFALAAVFGALAAFTRSPGILLIVPMGIEYIRILIETKKQEPKRFVPRLLGLGALTLSISLGLIAYLYINYAVWGNPLQFSVFQKEHWGQQMGFFWNTAGYEMRYFVDALTEFFKNTSDTFQLQRALALFGFNVLFIHGALFMVIAASKKMNAKYTGYFIVYYAFTIGATWLLSAPRYLMASIALPLSLACLTDKRRSDIIWTVVCSVLSLLFIILFAIDAPIY